MYVQRTINSWIEFKIIIKTKKFAYSIQSDRSPSNLPTQIYKR